MDLKKIRQELRYSDQLLIVKLTGLSRSMVNQVIRDKYPVDSENKRNIISAAVDIVRSRRNLAKSIKRIK
jgi:hypothetical protein